MTANEDNLCPQIPLDIHSISSTQHKHNILSEPKNKTPKKSIYLHMLNTILHMVKIQTS